LRHILIKLGAFSEKELLNLKKFSGKISRLIAKLRAHKIITKLNKTCRYRVIKSSEMIIARILMFKKFELKLAKKTSFYKVIV